MSQNVQNKNNQITETKTVENLNKSKEEKLKNLTNNKGKFIMSLLFVGILGTFGGFYAGKEVGRTLPATHRDYSKSQVLATVGDIKITGEDLSKKMEPYFYIQGLKKLSEEEIETQETNNYDPGTIISQSRAAGVEVKKGVSLKIIVAKAKTVTNTEPDTNTENTDNSSSQNTPVQQ